MSATLIDTNVFLRFLLADNPGHYAAATSLFSSIERDEVEAWTTEVALAEVVWVLTGPLNRLPRTEVVPRLAALLEFPGIRISNRRVLIDALAMFASSNLSWIDAYHVVLLRARGETQIYSFDRDFDRVPGIERLEA